MFCSRYAFCPALVFAQTLSVPFHKTLIRFWIFIVAIIATTGFSRARQPTESARWSGDRPGDSLLAHDGESVYPGKLEIQNSRDRHLPRRLSPARLADERCAGRRQGPVR